MNVRQAVLVFALAVGAAAAIEALAQGPRPAPGTTPPAKPAIATVGTRTVTREDWERRCEFALAEFSKRNGNTVLPAELRDLVRRQVLESQVRIELLVLEAKRTGVTASPLEAEAVLKQDPFFNPGGTFDESRFTAVRTTQSAAFDAAIATMREQVAARKLSTLVDARLRPAEDSLRREATRALSRATAEHLSLRRGDFDGSYPEPRERDVLDWYEAHRADYQRPDRATLTVAFVNSPGLSDSVRDLPGGSEAWSRGMRAVADSILDRIRAGATLEQAAGFLGPRGNTVVTSDNFPGYWRGAADVNRQLFDPRGKGVVLPQAVPAAEGWLVVRVDDVVPAHVAPLPQVAREIRGLLRRDRRAHADEYALRALFAEVRDSLAAPGWRFRVAIADTANCRIPAPSESDLDRFYRGHLADYSAFDSKGGGIVSRPLADVRDEVRARWYADRRRLETRLQADALLRAWRSGKRDAKLESALGARELEPAVRGSLLDAGAGTQALSDTVWSYPVPRGPGMVPIGRGWAVWTVAGMVERAAPAFEQARPLLSERLAARKTAELERGARRLFDENASRFAGGDVIYFSRFPVPIRANLDVALTRAEVDKYYRDHLERYSVPELVTARHVLVTPANETAEADRAARSRAEDVLRRARAGEEFAKLARENSDDAATREKGGDLGTFGRGTMLDAFERAVFALSPGDYAPQPVRTTLGWHVVYCSEHLPAVVHSLDWVYALVGSDAARAKSDRLAGALADSFVHALRGPAEARAAARALGRDIQTLHKRVGETSQPPALADYFQQLDRARPGQLVSHVVGMPGSDFWVTWIDSIGPGDRPTWESSRVAAREAHARGAGGRALEAKKLELDSLFAAGWSLDSVAALWGGLERLESAPPGTGLGSLGGAPKLDSLFVGSAGGAAPAALRIGQESGWVEFPNGSARVRLVARTEPAREQLLARMENERAAAIERGLIAYFEGLKRRWPVRILDSRMREVEASRPPPPGTP